MLVGAFFSVLAVDQAFESLHWSPVAASTAGLLTAVASGAALAAVLAFVTIQLRANPIIAGMAINIFAIGLTTFLFNTIFGFGGTPTSLPGIPGAHFPAFNVGPVHLASLSAIKPLSLGYVLFRQNPVVYIAILAAILFQILLFRTKYGLRLRSSGENPVAAQSAGVRVRPLRYGAVTLSGALAGLGGSLLVLNGSPPIFTPDITQGQGFIALAAVIVGRWTPLGALGACLVFGFGEALSVNIAEPVIGGFQVTDNLLAMIPYLVAIILAVGIVPASRAPASVGIPFDPKATV